ncbi:CDP-alcohol phosphatidyltransferase family protein [Chitinispirillales bacterium ANBcel5]|uniref:CDP-alcohol phosphatidyltransferase family protein n=1 Tax=Cellulosispirillum alkaliphilum TaxID=3039283 RepID=UPI002A4F0771|nr:CDP-alcohol phosphatidyltransferase family protein [Chitinispirillales bacterium ANBcel5]
MMLENFKPMYNSVLRPFVLVLANTGIHPNHVTILGLLLFATSGWLCAVQLWSIALLILILGALMDGLDGLLARETGKQTVFGAILDSSCDRVTEIALLMGLLVYYMHNPVYGSWGIYLCFTAIAGSIMVSYVKARCEGAGLTCSRGLLQRPERIILFAIGLLLGGKPMVWILLLITVLAAVTVIERLVEACIECNKCTDRTTARNSNTVN